MFPSVPILTCRYYCSQRVIECVWSTQPQGSLSEIVHKDRLSGNESLAGCLDSPEQDSKLV